MPSWAYTEWEDFEFDLDLELALADQESGAIEDGSFMTTDRVQLTALSVIPVAPDALLIANHAITRFRNDTGSVDGDDYGTETWQMPKPDYTIDAVELYAWRHAMDGDGGASFANWYTIDHHWTAMPEWDIPEGGHAGTYAGPGFPGDNPGVDLYDPYITPIDSDTQTVTVSWQLYGDTVDDSYTIKIFAGSRPDGDRTVGYSGVIIDVPINDLTVDIELVKGERHYVMVQWNGTDNMVARWEARGHRVLDPTTDAPTETEPGGRGFTVPSTWAWPPGSGTFWDQDTCVLVGSSWETTAERSGTEAYGDSDYTALDAAFIRAYQGYWTIKAASTWADNIPPSAAPPESSFEIHTDYGSSATYEYDWTGLGNITAWVQGPLRGAPSSPAQPVAAIEMRPSDYADAADLHEWKTILDLFATEPVDDVEFDATDGATLHVATNMTNDDPDVLAPAPMDYVDGWDEWGTIRPAVLVGTVRLIGQRRVKYAPLAIPPLKQRQRVSMNAVHATQAAAADPLRFRAHGDL